jgi:hypothetical protein
MNPIWALLFKDRIRTPFSVYKMSLAEVLVLGGILFGAGYGIGQFGLWIMNLSNAEDATVIEQPVVVEPVIAETE